MIWPPLLWKNDQKQLTYNYTLTVPRQLGWHTVLDLAYVGNTTHNIEQSWDFNALSSGVRFLPQSRDTTVTAIPAQSGGTARQFPKTHPGFGNITGNVPATTARYDFLQEQANRRFARGFEIAAAYTFAGSSSNGGTRTTRCPPARHAVVWRFSTRFFNLSYVLDLPRIN